MNGAPGLGNVLVEGYVKVRYTDGYRLLLLQLWYLQLFVSEQAIGRSRSGLLLAVLVLGDEKVDMEEASKFVFTRSPRDAGDQGAANRWLVYTKLTCPLYSAAHICSQGLRCRDSGAADDERRNCRIKEAIRRRHCKWSAVASAC